MCFSDEDVDLYEEVKILLGQSLFKSETKEVLLYRSASHQLYYKQFCVLHRRTGSEAGWVELKKTE